MSRKNVLRMLAMVLDMLGVGFLVAPRNSARKPEPEKAPVRPGVVRMIGVHGGDFWGSSVSTYFFGDSLIAFTRDARWFGFLRDRAFELDGESPERGHPLEKQLIIYDLTGPAKVPTERLNAGHGPLASGPHGSIAFYVKDPFQEARLFFPNVAPAPGGNDPAAAPEPPDIPEYVAVHWCEPGHTAYYRLPKHSGPRIRSQGPIRQLWFGINPGTKKPCLFALRIDGLLCMWELRDGGRPPRGNVRVKDAPRTINLFTSFGLKPQDCIGIPLSVAPSTGMIAFDDFRASAIRVIPLSPPHKPRTLQPVPDDDPPSGSTELLLSADGRYCLRLRDLPQEARTQEADVVAVRGPNVLDMWNTEKGTFLWRQKLPETSYISRVAFRPDGLRFVTWSGDRFSKFVLQDHAFPVPGDPPSADRRIPAAREKLETVTPESGTLHLWDSAKGTVVGTLPFALSDWPTALHFTPDGAQVVVLTPDGVCHFADTQAFRMPGG